MEKPPKNQHQRQKTAEFPTKLPVPLQGLRYLMTELSPTKSSSQGDSACKTKQVLTSQSKEPCYLSCPLWQLFLWSSGVPLIFLSSVFPLLQTINGCCFLRHAYISSGHRLIYCKDLLPSSQGKEPRCKHPPTVNVLQRTAQHPTNNVAVPQVLSFYAPVQTIGDAFSEGIFKAIFGRE